ncbi:MAG: hypothetical protein V1901_01575 [Patescibacteria group bacterium]
MKIYIASRFHKKEEVKKLYKLFINKGHKISSDWTLHKRIKPYKENQEIASQYATEDVRGVKNSDIFIMISDEVGTGMYTELGVAIASHVEFNKPKIYIIGDHKERSMFHFHPSINLKNNIEEVLKEIDK